MDIVRKVMTTGVFLNDDQLQHLGVKHGDFIILSHETKKYGNFISMFKPTLPEHLAMVEAEQAKTNK